MTTIALTGSSPAISGIRRALGRSQLPFELLDDAEHADLVVTDESAPSPNYLGVMSTSAPSTFFATEDSVDFIVAALTEAHLIDAHDVSVRAPIQNEPLRGRRPRWWRRPTDPLAHFDPIEFDWATDESVDTEVFEGAVSVSSGGVDFTAQLRARGYMDTNDGHFHWAGLLYGDTARELKEDGKTKATVSYAGSDPVPARLAEVTQWGVVRLTGVGTPPWIAAP